MAPHTLGWRLPDLLALAAALVLPDSGFAAELHLHTGKAPLLSREECSYESLYPRQYVAYHTAELDPMALDGDITKRVWEEVPWTDDFVDISTSTRPWLRTRAKMRWGSGHLFVAAELEEPHVWGTLRKDDTVIFQDNDFEIFVDPSGSNHFYKEFEMNALNSRWSLLLNKPYGDGGAENSTRISKDRGWTMLPHTKTAVQIHPYGAINNPSRNSTSWAVEVALPLADLAYKSVSELPVHETIWRIAFSRVEWHVEVNSTTGKYEKVPKCQSCPSPGGPHEDNWVWTPQGVIAMHNPELWGLLQFSTAAPSTTTPVRYEQWPCRSAAMAVYYAEKAFAQAHKGEYAADLSQLLPYSTTPFTLCTSAQTSIHVERSGNGMTFRAEVSPVGSKWAATVTDSRLLTVAPSDGLEVQAA